MCFEAFCLYLQDVWSGDWKTEVGSGSDPGQT